MDANHVRALVELEGSWPPIVVSRRGLQVVDGHHRVAAARILGHTTIAAEMFDGTPDDQYIEFVRRNVVHGRPLTLDERRQGAARVLTVHPDWSDRWIGKICGLSDRTVARTRAKLSSRDARCDSRRVGSDGKIRPLNPAAARQAIELELAAHPRASLRAIARAVGASPETVRSVRTGRAAGHRRESEFGVQPGLAIAPTALQPAPAWWAGDTALNSTEVGRRLAVWLTRSNVPESEWARQLEAVPLSRIYELAAEARRRAEMWAGFGESLERLAFPSRGGDRGPDLEILRSVAR